MQRILLQEYNPVGIQMISTNAAALLATYTMDCHGPKKPTQSKLKKIHAGARYLLVCPMGNSIAWCYRSFFRQKQILKYILNEEVFGLLKDPEWARKEGQAIRKILGWKDAISGLEFITVARKDNRGEREK